ncbi:hypothetical protein CEE44_02545 [Candidatus Woesearchaeota archaeon B3_Woes]|nr:MAG: hypothetical protein CEE44_02545 [Candidatus Woesearchaeota archaeon B3_Woes]
MKPKLKPIFLIFVVLVSFVVVGEGVVGDCVGDYPLYCSYHTMEPGGCPDGCAPSAPSFFCGSSDTEVCKTTLGEEVASTYCIQIKYCNELTDAVCPEKAPYCKLSVCSSGDQRLCSKTDSKALNGVCVGAQETCTNGVWPGCDSSTYYQHNDKYQESEKSCDGYDNDCDGEVDKINGKGCEYTKDGSKAAGRCVVRDNCETGEHFIISLSDPPYNAHASGSDSYFGSNKNNICCNISGFESISRNEDYTACGLDGHIISLSDRDNAHGSTYWRGDYSYEVCLTTDLDVDLDCQVTNTDQECDALEDSNGENSYFCMFSLAGEIDGEYVNNAHFASCFDDSDYKYEVCCSVKGGLAINDECSEDEECFAWDAEGDGKGHCVQYNREGEKRCQPLDPWAGDMYCDGDFINETKELEPEDVEKATRQKDVASCDPDPVCQHYTCRGGCLAQNLPAGEYSVDDPKIFSEEEAEDYSYLVAGEEYPYYTAIWDCNEFTPNEEKGDGKHCDGEGRCVTSCIDDDEDGYGIQPSNLYHAESCHLGSTYLDCMDNGTSESIDSTMNFNPYYINPGLSSSPFCDCDPNTPKLDWLDGVISGIDEGPINIRIPIEEDFCFDGYDNDCDGTIDCSDLDCSPEGYLSPIRNRTCGVNDDGESDCTDEYQTNPTFDQTTPPFNRACCPDELYCVIDGECVASGDLHGEFPDVHLCAMGQWYGSDTDLGVCKAIVNISEEEALGHPPWGLTGDAGDGACCGDDPEEYFTKGAYASYACCSKPKMKVIGGKCVGSLKEAYTWDKTDSGYCLDDTQCLVNPDELSFDKTVEDATSVTHYPLNEVRCINDGEFIGDHYCRNGEWTSRTALLIRQLMDIGSSSNEYSLFCDSYDKVLNFYGYSINEWYPTVNYFQTGGYTCNIGKGNIVPCINNLCVLKYDENKVIIGASINHDVDASSYSILEAIGGTNRDCSSVLDSSTFEVCGGGVYYNNKIKSVIYTRNEPSISDVLTGGEAAYIRNLFEPTLYYLQNIRLSYDYGFVNETSNFNKIYLHKKGEKSIYIITEEIKNKKYMSATYTNFNTNLCVMIENYKVANPVLVPFDCVKQGNVNYVFTGGLTQGYYELLNDLGPKLRIK